MRLFFAALLVLTLPASAASLSQASLQGSWTIVELMNEPDEEGDQWVFEGDQFIQVVGGRRITPDAFTVRGGVIDLGYAEITVTAFDGRAMEATMAGFPYRLVKD